tara:strand:- start:5011 stop:5364 length:354 start_codon:yes stop_codon:yes gene_type:complete
MRKFTASATLFLQLLLSNTALIATPQDAAGDACPHHSTNRECTMEMCPMNARHSPKQKGAQVTCPTTENLLTLVTQNTHEGSIECEYIVNIEVALHTTVTSLTHADHIVTPPTPPPC